MFIVFQSSRCTARKNCERVLSTGMSLLVNGLHINPLIITDNQIDSGCVMEHSFVPIAINTLWVLFVF